MKNSDTNNSEGLEPRKLDFHFSYKALVIINKSLDSLISDSITYAGAVDLSDEEIKTFFDFKACLCSAITGYILNPLPSNEPFMAIQDKGVGDEE
jgi:hypothetical protein